MRLSLVVSIAVMSCTPSMAPATKAPASPKPSAVVASSNAPTTKPTPPLPASGYWARETRVVRDTCTPKVASDTKERGLVVLARKIGSHIFFELPIVGLPGESYHRTLVGAFIGSSNTTIKYLVPSCAAYELRIVNKVEELAHDRIVLRRTVTYRPAAGCVMAAALPVQCDAELEETYTLTQARCELPCVGEFSTGYMDPGIRCVC